MWLMLFLCVFIGMRIYLLTSTLYNDQFNEDFWRIYKKTTHYFVSMILTKTEFFPHYFSGQTELS